MTDQARSLRISRRDLLKYGGLSAAAIGAAGLMPRLGGTLLGPAGVRADEVPPDLEFVGTDGWIYLPPDPPIGYFHPDSLAPAPLTTYVFGFRNVTGLTTAQALAQKNKAQHIAPLFWAKETVPGDPAEFRIRLTNVGLALRPDLFDEHTVHWHGFRNVITLFDGEPTGSISVPPGQSFTYVYRSHDPGTYMYHCHVEDTEHVHMGMTGLVFVRPYQDRDPSSGLPTSRLEGNTGAGAPMGYVYNDGDGSTAFDREYAMFLSEVWAEAHWADAHIQLPDWVDYRADFSLLNGRVYPDTLAPNGSIDPFHPVTDPDGDLIPTEGFEYLQYQPLSALVTCQPGERVLLRFANLGYKEVSMTLAGIKLHVVGRDATIMRGRDDTDTSYDTDTVSIGAGESTDAIFVAPAFSGGGGNSGQGYDTYPLYNRTYTRSDRVGASGGGGQRTEVRVYPSGLQPQPYPNDWGGAA